MELADKIVMLEGIAQDPQIVDRFKQATNPTLLERIFYLNTSGQRVRIWPDAILHGEVIDDPDPSEYDANGVTAPDAEGYRGLLGFEEYRTARIRNAIETGNAEARQVAENFASRFMWHDELDEYFAGRLEEIFFFIFDNHAWWKTFTMNDREFAVWAPDFDDGFPISTEGWVASAGGTGRTTIPNALILIDSLDEDVDVRVRQDKITPARAVEIAKEALDIELARVDLPGWDEFGNNS